MDPDERLTALKKAYADIILNTAKEAAARVLMSERKALRFQQELNVVKENALQMLLRLKQMMDSKINEAVVTSLSQQRKIEELEGQLQEAEDIVKDLREELREMQAELESGKNNKEQNLDEHDITIHEETPKENILCTSQCFTFPPPESQHVSVAVSDVNNSNLVQKCYNSVNHTGNSYAGNPDLPSIILRRKEPELYRNGCTQRIRACERNLLDGELSVSEKLNHFKHETSAKEAERICTESTHAGYNMCSIEKKEVVQEDSRLNSWYQVWDVNRYHRKLTRANIYRRTRTPSSSYLPDQLTKTEQSPDMPCLETSLNPIKNAALYEEDPSKVGPRLSLDKTETFSHRGSDVLYITNKGESLIDNLTPSGRESGSIESSVAPVCKMDHDKGDVPLANSDSKASDTTEGIPRPPVNNRIIKYTFQRKRKRESLSNSDGNVSLEKGTLKKNAGEKEVGSLEPQKSSLIAESSRESRRLALVARQLISLSEKKWGQ